MINNVPLPVVIFICLLWLLGLVSVFKAEAIVNLTARYMKWSMKLFGFEGEIRPTLRAKVICRNWNLFFLLYCSVFIFLILTGKLK